jgi:hypothetical protein
MIGLGSIMSLSQKMAVEENKIISCHRKLASNASWKQSAIKLTLDSVYIFNGNDV